MLIGLAFLAALVYVFYSASQSTTEVAVARDHDMAKQLYAEQADSGDWHSAFSLGLICLDSGDVECAETRLAE